MKKLFSATISGRKKICITKLYSWLGFLFGVFSIFFATILMCLVLYVFWFLISPSICVQSSHISRGVHYLLLGIFSYGMLMSYVFAIFTNPGKVAYESATGHKAPIVKLSQTWANTHFCTECRPTDLIPSRAWHCYICGYCISRRDHHCFWINQCVGILNFKYFILFIIYLWTFTTYCTILLMGIFLEWMTYHERACASHLYHKVSGSVVLASPLLRFCLFLCGSVSLALSIFTAWHLHMLCLDKTTREFYYTSNAHACDLFLGIWHKLPSVFFSIKKHSVSKSTEGYSVAEKFLSTDEILNNIVSTLGTCPKAVEQPGKFNHATYILYFFLFPWHLRHNTPFEKDLKFD